MNRTMDNFKFTSGDILGVVIFVFAVTSRGLLEVFAPTPMDYGWVTNFAAIAAAWLSLGSRSRDIHKAAMEAKETALQVEENTNGKLAAKLEQQTEIIVSTIKAEDPSETSPLPLTERS